MLLDNDEHRHLVEVFYIVEVEERRLEYFEIDDIDVFLIVIAMLLFDEVDDDIDDDDDKQMVDEVEVDMYIMLQLAEIHQVDTIITHNII